MPADAKVENKNSGGTYLHVAAIQMEAKAAPKAERLARAEQLVAGAAAAGAQLVLLPECFNTGYTYSEENHARVERIDGPTATWLRETASRLDIYIAGLFPICPISSSIACCQRSSNPFIAEDSVCGAPHKL